MLNKVSIPFIFESEKLNLELRVQAGRLVAKATSDVTASSSWQRKVTGGSDMDIPLLESNDEGYQGEVDADTYQKGAYVGFSDVMYLRTFLVSCQSLRRILISTRLH
jgi:hypothetical protein